ncbi:DUF2721 domain-containing protein [Egbenema bharatensis]|uniref:DUF2721 domain-containing protein n=1 Tax=Egbenema bharatensis TaxID=3463334 RepID=UPI003A897D9F
MSIEQTDQLIRLVLNSLLLVLICVAVVNGLLMRQTAFANRLRQTQKEYLELLDGGLFRNDRRMQLKGQLRQLRYHYRVAHASLLTAHYALLLCMTSTVVVAFRMLLPSNWLIYAALVLFVLGTIVLLFSIGLTLLDVYATNHSLGEEITWILRLGAIETGSSRISAKPTSPQNGSLPLAGHRPSRQRQRVHRQLNRTAN